MVMLSELLRYRVIDVKGEQTKLVDLVISQLDTDYPPVTDLIYRSPTQKEEFVLPWKSVKAIDRKSRQIKVENH